MKVTLEISLKCVIERGDSNKVVVNYYVEGGQDFENFGFIAKGFEAESKELEAEFSTKKD